MTKRVALHLRAASIISQNNISVKFRRTDPSGLEFIKASLPSVWSKSNAAGFDIDLRYLDDLVDLMRTLGFGEYIRAVRITVAPIFSLNSKATSALPPNKRTRKNSLYLNMCALTLNKHRIMMFDDRLKSLNANIAGTQISKHIKSFTPDEIMAMEISGIRYRVAEVPAFSKKAKDIGLTEYEVNSYCKWSSGWFGTKMSSEFISAKACFDL